MYIGFAEAEHGRQGRGWKQGRAWYVGKAGYGTQSRAMARQASLLYLPLFKIKHAHCNCKRLASRPAIKKTFRLIFALSKEVVKI